ncbi:glycosyltransferase family 2 protein [Halomicronema sp. CCY15110]|uniref:glycosyltransferase family 2 protein n=1 Tax=Halomicronema sp. CCY15110 TaxID=2767773 RepID=UPI0019505F5B|nr:glycosyltransferase [Halomicronema sp. CCY15110]
MTTSISICIATYKRPQGLFRLLESINTLRFSELETPTIEVVIADNDKAGSAKQIYESVKPTFNWKLVYGIEPHQGVTFARNRSLALASPDADFFVFIDDDEVPDALWLETLLICQKEYDADVVTGPITPKFEVAEVPSWVLKGGFFDPVQHETGKLMGVAFTNNTLVKSQLIRQIEIPFDDKLAFKGAEDVDLFTRLFAQGAKIVWCSEAMVYEFIPENRMRVKWLLDRNYYGYSAHSVTEKKYFPSVLIQAQRVLKGFLNILLGLCLLAPGLLLGRHRIAQSLIYVYRGFGSLSGLVNIRGAWGGAHR